ncbi:unnamed protein product, partial [Eretmochelys imbricata]
MKILYLLFAVFFLVLQDAPEFSEAQDPFKLCRSRRGFCSYKRCPFNSKLISRCAGRFLCCRSIQDTQSGYINFASSTAPQEAVGR